MKSINQLAVRQTIGHVSERACMSRARARMCVCVCACMRARVRVCVCVCVTCLMNLPVPLMVLAKSPLVMSERIAASEACLTDTSAW